MHFPNVFACLYSWFMFHMTPCTYKLKSFNNKTTIRMMHCDKFMNGTLMPLHSRACFPFYQCVCLFVPRRPQISSYLKSTHRDNSIDTKTVSVRLLEAKLLLFENLNFFLEMTMCIVKNDPRQKPRDLSFCIGSSNSPWTERDLKKIDS